MPASSGFSAAEVASALAGYEELAALAPAPPIMKSQKQKHLDVCLTLLERTWTQLGLGIVVCAWIGSEMWCSIKAHHDKSTKAGVELSRNLIGALFALDIVAVTLLSRGVRDYTFASSLAKVTHKADWFAFKHHMVSIGAGAVALVTAVYIANTTEHLVSCPNLLVHLLAFGLPILYLVTTARDMEDAAHITQLNALSVEQRYELGKEVLGRSDLQIVVISLVLLWETYQNYQLLTTTTVKDDKVEYPHDQVLAYYLLGAMMLMAVVAVFLISTGLRDVLLEDTVSKHLGKGSGNGGGGGSRDRMVLFAGVVVLLVLIAMEISLRDKMPWRGLLAYIAAQGLAWLIFITAIRDRSDANRIDKLDKKAF